MTFSALPLAGFHVTTVSIVAKPQDRTDVYVCAYVHVCIL